VPSSKRRARTALDHLLGRAAADVKRRYGLGGDAGPHPAGAAHPVPAARGARFRSSPHSPGARRRGGGRRFLYFRDKARRGVRRADDDARAGHDRARPHDRSADHDDAAAAAGLGDRLVRNGVALTPVQPVDVNGHLCLVFIVSGEPPLNFVPAEAVLISDRLIEPALDFPTQRATSDVVYGEPQPTSREVCWPVVGWRQTTTELLYTLNDTEYR
jgi:hypothetical protein